jgi:glycerol-3-phosphate dehydrogenase
LKITVIGCGRWGSFIAWYLDSIGHSVTLYGLSKADDYKQLKSTRTNGMVKLSENISLTTSLLSTKEADCIVVSIPSQNLSSLMNELKVFAISSKPIVLCMKGIDIDSGRRLSEIASEQFYNVAVWVGPGHVQSFVKGEPGCMVIDSINRNLTKHLINEFQSPKMRFYIGNDIIGSELGAATKNIMGIAAGMLDGLGFTSLKGPLMARGPAEIYRFIEAMGGNGRSAYGLCHLGDYEATLFSPFSHNRAFGENFIKNKQFDKLAEGCYTVKAVFGLAEKYNIDLPICSSVYRVIYENVNVKDEIENLFKRSLKTEF